MRNVHRTMDAWWHRIGESGKPTRSWAACFPDPAKQTNFWDMAMARANELANLNIVVEKWGSSKIGGSKGKPGGAKGYTTARAGASNTRAAAQEAASSIQDQVAGMPAAAQAALL
jgi:hypothetical protein